MTTVYLEKPDIKWYRALDNNKSGGALDTDCS